VFVGDVWVPDLSGWTAMTKLTNGPAAIATTGARMYPILPCGDIDEAIAFYEALGFKRTYRQTRPNPSAVVAFGELHVHLGGIEGFDPEQSYASVIIVVPDPDALYRQFADGLRAAYGRVPVSGIPRVVRPRKRWGTVYGFSLVDVGGNWLRISRLGDSEDQVAESEAGLARGIDVAARLADAHGDDAGGLATLERMLAKHAGAPAIERARALAYRADLAVRLERRSLARASLDEIATLPLSDDERAGLVADIEYIE
jgi:catechol 2,3-dioxygenase-like lactoylglutathione lyase family enzyme